MPKLAERLPADQEAAAAAQAEMAAREGLAEKQVKSWLFLLRLLPDSPFYITPQAAGLAAQLRKTEAL